MSVNFVAKGVYPYPVEKVVQARLEKLHKEKDSFLNVDSGSVGKDGELDYSKQVVNFTNTIPAITGIFAKRLGLIDDQISKQEEVWSDRPNRLTWIRTSWLSFADKFAYVEVEVYEPHHKNPEMTKYERNAAAEVTTTGILGQATKFLLKSIMKQSFKQDTKLMHKLLD